MDIKNNNNLASQNLANIDNEQQNNNYNSTNNIKNNYFDFQGRAKDNQNENENEINNNKISFLEKPVIPERTISNYYGDEILVDAILKVDNFELPFHKIVLCSASDFLNNYFKRNKDTTQKAKVDLPEMMKSSLSKGDKKECIDKIFKYCYYNQDIKSIESDITQNNCFTFLELAHCLQIKSLCINLEKIIIQKFLNNENIFKISEECHNFELDDLLKECSKKIKENLGNIQNNKKELVELKYNSFKDIVSSDELDVEQEKDVADLVIEYIKSRRSIPEEKKEENKENSEKNEKKEEPPENKENENKKENKEKKASEQKKNDNNENKKEEEDPYINWKHHLEKLKKNSIKNRLKPEEEKMLILCIRFSYLSHADLIELTNEPIMEKYQDLILQGISARLDTYENSKDKKTIINLAPRHYLRGQQGSNIKNRINYNDDNNEQNNNDNRLPGMSRYNGQKNISNLYQFNYDDNNNINNNMSNSNNLKRDLLNTDDINTRKQIEMMAKSSPGPYSPQDARISDNFYHSQRNISNYNPIFKYVYDFDENGALYYLGTRAKQYQYRNPHELRLVTAFGSSLSTGQISDFVGRNLVNLRTENEENSFFGVDLGENRTLMPTAYSIRNRNSSTHVLLCWNLEASNDRINFEIIDTRIFNNVDNPQIHQRLEKERNLLKEPGCTSTWGISRKVRQRYPDGFRYFLIKQIDKNSNGTYNLTNSGFELYGEAKGNGWIFN